MAGFGKTPFEKILQWSQEKVFDDLHMVFDWDLVESPIEKALLAAIYAKLSFDERSDTMVVLYDQQENGPFDPLACNCTFEKVILCPQEKVGRYKADILIWVNNQKGWVKIVVECDGHNFHERTKEQAAHDRSRDRKMVTDGITVLRFTGSEIHRDPMKCAEEVSYVISTVRYYSL